MTTNPKNNVIVELYDLSITSREDDRFGRVVTSKSLSEDDLIAIAAARRTELSPDTLKASLQILKNIAIEQVANGASVLFGLGYYSLSVNGVFYGNNAKWDSQKHSLSVRIIPTADLRAAVEATIVDVRGMASAGLVINEIADVASGQVNGRLTPGGAVNLLGTKIKIVGDAPANCISLINQATGTIVKIPVNAVAVNEPSKITFVVPASLPQGDYKLSIATQFSGTARILNEPRVYTFDYILSV